ncbi:SDR family oxidoreductase [Rhizobium sp. 0TCS1.26]|uniref:SDR family oxidoreductase n=1 Tax=Rhizobium sp. 0TCS1.26 TaxID=3142623 RepID=UPI003D2BD883
MSIDLAHAVVVITGASSGIGQATAEAFARRGSRLVLAARSLEALEKVAETCRSLGAEAVAVETDVTDPQAVVALASKAEEFGRIDVWVSNVGIGAVGRFHETPIEAHEQVVRANLLGHINDAHAVVPIFLRQGHGVFINMISLGGFAAAPFAAAYSASKFGLRGFAEALRAELADKPNIHICDIYPAFVDTPGLRHGANYVGREITAPPPVINARRVARAIVEVAISPRPSTTVGSVTAMTRLAHLVAPNFAARTLGRFMEGYFERAPRVEVSSGNLYGPPARAGGIDGGFRSETSHTSRNVVLALTAIAALAAGAAVASGSHRRRRSIDALSDWLSRHR